MKHISIKMDTPVEFVNVTKINPLISKCQIKVCYVGEEPNRNGTIITKEVAERDIANSLPGSPIVGFFNAETQDFEEHNKYFEVDDDGNISISDDTRPYGFVDLNAKVWFQKFMDDGVEHEYLMTEGNIWTGQYPESDRIIQKGNNQSMELDGKFLSGEWTKDDKNQPQFFIVNSAIISKLCILGEEFEPCFEGSTITAPTIEFKLDDKYYTIIENMQKILEEKGEKEKVFTQYSLSIGDAVWTSLYTALNDQYDIKAVYNEGPIVLVQEKGTENYKTVTFAFNTEDSTVTLGTEFTDVNIADYSEDTFVSSEEIANWVEKNFSEPEDKTDENEPSENQNNIEPEKDVTESEEYIALNDKYVTLQNDYETLKKEIESLREFKLNIERQEKQEMIDSFDELTDEEKDEVVKNIDAYSLNTIEEKLSVIVRHKGKKEKKEETAPTTYTLNNGDDNQLPEWVTAVQNIEKELNT